MLKKSRFVISRFECTLSFKNIGWTQDTEELTEVSIMPTDNNICEEISEVSPNTLCTEEKTAPGIPCSGEEFAGAPLMCQRNNNQWFLVGILAWRKGCSTVGKKYIIIGYNFTSNHHIHKSLCSVCFWAPGPLIDMF